MRASIVCSSGTSRVSASITRADSLKADHNISIYKLLYPPIKESFIQDENNTINNKILKLKEDLPLLRYKKSSKTNKNFKIDEEISLMSNDEEEDLKMTDEFLADLIKVPCPISKTKIIAIVSNFIRKSKLIGKLESEYQSDKKADLNNLSVLCAEHLTYKELKKGEVIFKIGEFGYHFGTMRAAYDILHKDGVDSKNGIYKNRETTKADGRFLGGAVSGKRRGNRTGYTESGNNADSKEEADGLKPAFLLPGRRVAYISAG